MNVSAGPRLRTDRATAIDITLITDVTVIAALWCVSSLIVNPIGEFPQNDDWSYALAVKHLLETGDYRPLGWASMTLITNVLWGSLFCLPGGFSFTALRVSTLAASLLALIGTYILVRDLHQPRWLALVIALTLAFNPLYYALSHTFMTDVLFVTLSVWAAIFLARSLISGSDLQMLTGTTLAVAATLSRQFGLCIPLAFAVTLVLRRGLTLKTVLRAIIPLLACVAAFLIFIHWLSASGRLPALYGMQLGMFQGLIDIKRFAMRLLAQTSFSSVYLGLFLLPVLLVSIVWSHGKRAIYLVAGGVLTIALGLIILALYGYAILIPVSIFDGILDTISLVPVPMPGNILINSGIGPLTLRDTYLLELDHVPAMPIGVWAIVTALGLTGSILLVVKLSIDTLDLAPRLLRKTPLTDAEIIGVFLVLSSMLYVLLLNVVGLFYDRYLIPSIPFFASGFAALSGRLAESASGATKTFRVTAFALLAAFCLYAVCGTRDYLEWQRLRWQALHELMNKDHIPAAEIDGGFEFNAVYFYDPRQRLDYANHNRSWWWVHGDTYQIAFGPVPGYTVVKEYTYRRWLVPKTQTVVVLRKEQ